MRFACEMQFWDSATMKDVSVQLTWGFKYGMVSGLENLCKEKTCWKSTLI